MLKGKSKVGIIFSGGPAPAANAVISAAALNFMNAGISVIGFYGGYKNLVDFDKNNPHLKENEHYIQFDSSIGDIRNRRGIFIETSRTNPGKEIKQPDDFKAPAKVKKLYNVLDALDMLDIGLLISIGGDDTLRTANLLSNIGLSTIHVPKTIDNDYFGIPWTFGYWTSVDVAKRSLINLQSDAQSTGSYYIAEIMGRKAGWLTYAAGLAGGAIKMLGVEDLSPEENLDIDTVCNEIVDLILTREEHNRFYGVICVAEGLADRLPSFLKPTEKDTFGHTELGKAQIGQVISSSVKKLYKERMGKDIKMTAKQIGYETRSAEPVGYDVVLASMLGYGSFKLLSEEKTGHMVSVSNNFDVIGIPFDELIDPVTLTTKVRVVDNKSDFYKLKNALSYHPL